MKEVEKNSRPCEPRSSLPHFPLPLLPPNRIRRRTRMASEAEANNVTGVLTHGGRYVHYNIFGNLLEVSRKYAPPIRPIGSGAYGIVWLAPPLLLLLQFDVVESRCV